MSRYLCYSSAQLLLRLLLTPIYSSNSSVLKMRSIYIYISRKSFAFSHCSLELVFSYHKQTPGVS